jgi:hypothetical protein
VQVTGVRFETVATAEGMDGVLAPVLTLALREGVEV